MKWQDSCTKKNTVIPLWMPFVCWQNCIIFFIFAQSIVYQINAQVKVWRAYMLFKTMHLPTKIKLYSLSYNKKKGDSAGARTLFSWPKSPWLFIYSEIPLLRPPKIKTSYLLKTLFAKSKLLISSFSTLSVPLIRDHLWNRPKVVFKTTFGRFKRWS